MTKNIQILTWLKSGFKSLFEVPQYTPQKRIPLPQKASRRADVVVPKGEYSNGFKALQTTNTDDNGAITWEKAKATIKKNVRSPQLTEFDVIEIQQRDLNINVGQIVKPYFFNEVSRYDAAKAINQKGIHQSLIGKYYAAFNAALEKD